MSLDERRARLDALQRATVELGAPRQSGRARGPLVILRHSIRGPIPKHPDLRDVPLTDAGHDLATALGAGWRLPVEAVISSPMRRCRDTAHGFVAASAALDVRTIPTTTRLGDPGPFVLDSAAAWDNYFRLGKHALVRTMLERPDQLPGYRALGEGVALLLEELERPRVTLAFSHDLIMALVIGWVRGEPLADHGWPDFCDGLVLVRHADRDATVWYDGARWSRALPGRLR